MRPRIVVWLAAFIAGRAVRIMGLRDSARWQPDVRRRALLGDTSRDIAARWRVPGSPSQTGYEVLAVALRGQAALPEDESAATVNRRAL